jgi:hypothetical protein
MVFNHHFWSKAFRRDFVPQLWTITEALEKRISPAFDKIVEEAETVSNEAWEAYMNAPGTGDEDRTVFAELAEEAGVARYLLLNDVRQGITNLFAAALYHTYEQQVMLFLRKQVLHPSEEDDEKLFNWNEFQTRLRNSAIDITTFPSWKKIDELRHVTNTVKHAEGVSAQKLHQLRPDLFVAPGNYSQPASEKGYLPHVFMPLAGRDLYVTLKDVLEYRDCLINFWEELSNAMERD